MAEPMRVEVVSPEQVLFRGEATMVITRTLGGGEIAFMAGHQPFVGALVESDTALHLVDGKVQHVAVLGGFVEVGEGGRKVAILSDEAELAERIDVAAAERDREAAEADLRSRPDDESAAARVRRASARIAAGSHGR